MTEPSPAAVPVPATPSAPRAVLVGPMGAGKTSVAAELGRRWGVAVRDTDADVETIAGKPIADIFVDDGENAFRALERSAVATALAEHSGVLALGGGAILDADTRRLLRGHRVVFLDVGLAAAAARVGLGSTRPLLLGNVRGQLKTLMDLRRPLYEEVASMVVHTDEIDVEAVADEVERQLDA